MSTRTYTLDSLRLEIKDFCGLHRRATGKSREAGAPKDPYASFFKAELFPLLVGWDEVNSDIDHKTCQSLEKLIALAIEGRPDEWGRPPEFGIGQIIVDIARKLTEREYDDIVREFMEPGEPEYGTDVRDPIAVDRSAA